MVSSSVQYAYFILFDLNNKINSTGFLIQKKKEQVFKMNALSNISLSKKNYFEESQYYKNNYHIVITKAIKLTF
jgi:hypothetical protein